MNDNDQDNKEEKKSGNQEQSTAQKASEGVNNTINMAKDGLNLAKNIQTGNVIGAVKDAVNLLKNKKFRRMLLINFISSILPLLLAGALILGIFGAVGDFFESLADGIAKAFTIDTTGSIGISDEEIDTIVNGISNMGVSMDGLKLLGDVDYTNPDIQAENKEKSREYIRKFYEAQEMTKTLNTKPDWLETWAAGDKPYGNVYVHRDRSNSETIEATSENQLEYIKYSDMVEMKRGIENKTFAADIFKYFSIDDEGKLVYATAKSYGDPDYIDEYKLEITLKHADYLDSISQYTTSMDFYIYLTMLSQNPEFASKVADLAKQSEIRIMIIDEGEINETTVTTKYDQNVQKVIKEENEGKTEYKLGEVTTEENKEEKRSFHNSDGDSRVVVSYVKTWFCEQKINYVKKEDVVSENTTTEPPEDQPASNEDKPEIPLTEESVGKEYIWKTNIRKTTTVKTNRRSYEIGTSGDVKDRTGEKGSQGVNSEGNVDEKTTFIGLMDNEFEIPNSSRKEAAGSNLVSSAEMLFELLKNHSTTQNIEQYMRYIMNKYKNTTRYGNIKYEDLASQMAIREISSGGNYTVNTLMSAKNLCITDSNVLKKAINKLDCISENSKKNLLEQVDSFLGMQKKYNVNAVFAIAVSIAESGAGTATDCPNDYSKTNNWWNVTVKIDDSYYNLHDYDIKDLPSGVYPDKVYYYSSTSGNPNIWKVYKDVNTAIYKFGDVIANNDGWYFKEKHYTVDEISLDYVGRESSDPVIDKEIKKNAKIWASTVKTFMNEIYAVAEIKTTSGFTEGGVTNDQEAELLNTKIMNEYFKGTTPHPTTFYKEDEFIDWFGAKNDIFALQNAYNDPEYPFQCTWWAWGRASMYLESIGSVYPKYPTARGNGGDYYTVNQEDGWFNYGQTPRPNSIISWSKGEYGHVAYVEGVTEDGIYISHAGSGNSWFGVQKISLDGDLESIGWSGYTLNGYIYLDEPIRAGY